MIGTWTNMGSDGATYGARCTCGWWADDVPEHDELRVMVEQHKWAVHGSP